MVYCLFERAHIHGNHFLKLISRNRHDFKSAHLAFLEKRRKVSIASDGLASLRPLGEIEMGDAVRLSTEEAEDGVKHGGRLETEN